jgi:hypothetical protein
LSDDFLLIRNQIIYIFFRQLGSPPSKDDDDDVHFVAQAYQAFFSPGIYFVFDELH